MANRSQFPRDMKRFGQKPRRGMLLYGPPGCSKTMIAKALASESDLNFLAVQGAELVSMYVGESERKVRELFSRARAVSPSIIFFDEIDAIVGKDGDHGGIQIGTTLLNELDGIRELKDVFVLAATNKPDIIPPALTRPGRLEKTLYVGPPDLKARNYIFERGLQSDEVAEDVDFMRLAAAAEGYSGAEIVNICLRAGQAALEEEWSSKQPKRVEMSHYTYALSLQEKSITPELIASYEAFAAARLSRG